jgi:uncharacterized protein (TIGR03435 family)
VVKALIGWAYTVGRDAVFKVPTWAEHEETTYNIDATSPPETSDEQCRAMLRNALAERFRLRAHTETMERFSDYVLVIDKAGIKLKPSATHGSAHITMGPGGLSARDTSMNILTAYLSEKLGAVVKNATGLETTPFDFDLDFALADPNDVDPLHAEIFEALPQQLGLRLIKKRVAESFPVVIVDQLERPSSN